MKLLFAFLILNKLIFGQYDKSMYDLIETTFDRSFNKEIISAYLFSDDDTKIRAAILSIAQSEDTSFVTELINLDLKIYGEEICFALAQIGKCDKSINFLWNYLYSSPLSNHYSKIFFAIGKIGDENDLKKLVEFYNSFDGPIFPYEGISAAILEFYLNGIKSDEARTILETEATHPLSTSKRIEQALFSLARYEINQLTDSQIQRLFKLNFVDHNEIAENSKIYQFALMNIKRKWLIDKSDLLNGRIKDLSNILFKIGLVKVLHNLQYISKIYPNENIDEYFELLNDSNPNVAIQSAISIKNIKNHLNDSSSFSLKNKIDALLFNDDLSKVLRGELLLSRFNLFGNYYENLSLLEKIELPLKYRIQVLSLNPDKQAAVTNLSKLYWPSGELKIRIDALSEIIKYRNNLTDKTIFNKIVFDALQSDNPPLISIAADGLDLSFISENSAQLKELISLQLEKFKDDPNFLEAIMSLVNLAEKIEGEFYSQIVSKINTSKLYSIRRFIANKTGEKVLGFKEPDKFEDIWNNAFKYNHAIIQTTKGDIVIAFNSEVAPISVANFCLLAKANFYDGIVFHRVVPGFVIQAGDPTATGWGGPGYDIVSEFSDSDFNIGYVGMASAGKDTESSQFFIMQGCYPHLNSRYTMFANVIKGLDVVYKITEEDKINSIVLK